MFKYWKIRKYNMISEEIKAVKGDFAIFFFFFPKNQCSMFQALKRYSIIDKVKEDDPMSSQMNRSSSNSELNEWLEENKESSKLPPDMRKFLEGPMDTSTNEIQRKVTVCLNN